MDDQEICTLQANIHKLQGDFSENEAIVREIEDTLGYGSFYVGYFNNSPYDGLDDKVGFILLKTSQQQIQTHKGPITVRAGLRKYHTNKYAAELIYDALELWKYYKSVNLNITKIYICLQIPLFPHTSTDKDRCFYGDLVVV